MNMDMSPEHLEGPERHGIVSTDENWIRAGSFR